MGCGPSTLAIVELNRCLKNEGAQGLQGKLQTSPWLLSAATPVISSTAGTALHAACERKQVQVVQQMLSFLSCTTILVVREALRPYCRRNSLNLPNSVSEGLRLAVDMVNCKGQTPLMLACAAGSPELVKLLLAQGADPWAGDRCGCRTAIHYAAMSGSVLCIEALMLNIPVRNMARLGVRYVDVRSTSGLTALHYAAFFEHPLAVEELLCHHPNVNAASCSHSYDVFLMCDPLSIPLHFAAIRGNLQVAQLLLRYHATQPSSRTSRDPRLRANDANQLPWQVAAFHHPANRDIVALLHPGRTLEEALGMSMSGGIEAGSLGLCHLGPIRNLASIAAAALQTQLLGQLQQLQSAAEGGGEPQGGCSAVSAEEEVGVEHVGMHARDPTEADPSPGSMLAPSLWEESKVDEGEECGGICGVCFARCEAVAPVGCGHGVCGECAVQMARGALAGSRPRPLLCPFCRTTVKGFVAISKR